MLGFFINIKKSIELCDHDQAGSFDDSICALACLFLLVVVHFLGHKKDDVIALSLTIIEFTQPKYKWSKKIKLRTMKDIGEEKNKLVIFF